MNLLAYPIPYNYLIPYKILVLYFLAQTILTQPPTNFLNYKMFSLTRFISVTLFIFPIRETFLLNFNTVNSTIFMCWVRGLNLFLNINTIRSTTLICPVREKFARLSCLPLDSTADRQGWLIQNLRIYAYFQLIFNSLKHFIAFYVLPHL